MPQSSDGDAHSRLDLRAAIEELVSHTPSVRAIYLFGSRAHRTSADNQERRQWRDGAEFPRVRSRAGLLLVTSLREWLPEHHLAWFSSTPSWRWI